MAIFDQTFVYNNFNLGLNTRDSEITLEMGETPRAQNHEIVRKSGLRKKKGIENWYPEYESDISWRKVFNYTDEQGVYRKIGISYPDIYVIDPPTGAINKIYSSLLSTGNPQATETNDGKLFIVDGANQPVVIEGSTATTVTWPQSFTEQNTAPGNVEDSVYATGTNPSVTTIGFPSFCAFFKNRIYVGDGSKYIFASTAGDYTDFGSNLATDFDIAFWFIPPGFSQIRALKIISNENLIIYGATDLLVMTGTNPPGTAYPDPLNLQPLNVGTGCLGPDLIEFQGNNDHFFLSNEGAVYQLTSTENFQQVRPLGLSDKIFPNFERLKTATLERGFMINHKIRGELWLFIPSQDYYSVLDQAYVLNYATMTSPEDARWVPVKDYADYIKPRSGYIDRTTFDMHLVTKRNIMAANSGTSFNGGDIKMVHQLPAFDFGAPENNKEIGWISLYATTTSGATVRLLHLWDTGESGETVIQIPASSSSTYGFAVYTSDPNGNVYTSDAGEPFERTRIFIQNPIGRILKMTIIEQSATSNLVIDSVRFNFRVYGKT
jgi:hypothetical protein